MPRWLYSVIILCGRMNSHTFAAQSPERHPGGCAAKVLVAKNKDIMKETTKKNIKKGAKIAGIALGLTAVAGIAFVYGYTPKPGSDSPRALLRLDGVPKKAFKTARRANLQCIIQLVRYGELCLSYRVGDKFYTGHNRKVNKAVGRVAGQTLKVAKVAALPVGAAIAVKASRTSQSEGDGKEENEKRQPQYAI